MSEAQLRYWLGQDRCRGFAFKLGPASQNIYVRDWDVAEKRFEWKQQHPELDSTLTTVETPSGGYHQYFRSSTPVKTQFCVDGEKGGMVS